MNHRKKFKPVTPKTQLNIRGLDGNLHSQFKASCARRKVSMKQQLEKMIREFISKDVQSEIRGPATNAQHTL